MGGAFLAEIVVRERGREDTNTDFLAKHAKFRQGREGGGVKFEVGSLK